MISQIYVFIGFLGLLASLGVNNAIVGTQVALLGIGFILLGIFNVINGIRKDLKQQNAATE